VPRIEYLPRNFKPATLAMIATAEGICEEYAAGGDQLTLRQLYYQFVARGLLANKQTEYDRLGETINAARLAGLIDWDHLEDRTRNLEELPTWGSPASIMSAAAEGYREALWEEQEAYVEVWVEKEALAGVVGRVADEWAVPYFSCRGYVSQSEMWRAAQRLEEKTEEGKRVVVLHLGDHDPSGLDMTRDIESRLEMFYTGDGYYEYPEVRRIALNMDQVERYGPPPNPAKFTDSRAVEYVRRYGSSSWELDALDPPTLRALIASHIEGELDMEKWEEAREAQERSRQALTHASRYWPLVVPAVLELAEQGASRAGSTHRLAVEAVEQ
jgi:hypothetical protein